MSHVPNQISKKVRKGISSRFMFGSFLEGFRFFLCDGAASSRGVLNLPHVGDECIELTSGHLGYISVQELVDWHVVEQVCGVGF